jgi:BirA family biotin operon repressor/biotin-[acetyl-CoA-carboxylase] ligase
LNRQTYSMTKLGSEIHHLSVVDSTNNYAAKLISDGQLQNGSVIMADFQTNGRGQRGNSWQSVSQDNLLFSLAFQPVSVAADQQIRINWYTALIWIKCCKRFSIDAQIKWPNDIFVGQQKLGGILIEQQIHGSNIAWSVVGCGINVNATPALPNACSIFELTNVRFQPKTVLNEFLDLYNGQIQLLYGDFQELKTAFEAELFGKDTIQEFIDVQQQAWPAKIIGVDNQGKLLLEKNDVVQAYDLQQVRLVLPA